MDQISTISCLGAFWHDNLIKRGPLRIQTHAQNLLEILY